MIAHVSAGTRTVSDSPNGAWLHPQLRKAAGRYTQAGKSAVYNSLKY
ncbi:MAG: hypothetical protein FWG22_04775 [Prolixibacteraceae bacterium]|nr:hypothetical protein [Prolixibacteraceae bacterium]